MHPFPNDQDVVWRPEPGVKDRAVLTAFARRLGLDDLDSLLAYAEAEPERFWQAVLDDLAWRWRKPPERILDLSRGPAWPHWFVGGETNLVDQVLRPERTGTALIWEGEDGAVRRLTYPELAEAVERTTAGLESLGVGPGDRVGVFLPMLPETVVAFYATAALGAVVIPIFSGYGAAAVASRLTDAAARVLVTADGFFRRGRRVPMLATAAEALTKAPSVEHVVVVPRLGEPVSPPYLSWTELLGRGARPAATVPADQRFMIIYTSGTTGRPKGAVHVHTGFPVKAAQDLRLCFDLRPDDTLFWLTDLGWMMGPWAILGAGIVGASLLLYEGTPDYPDAGRLWQLVEHHRVSVFGISPTAIRALMAHGDDLVRAHDLRSLRVLGSTGEPWNPEAWHWFFRTVGQGRLPVINYSGGTEISGGILGAFVTEPLKPCSFRGPVPGMAARVLDEAGQPVRGAVGELALTRPWVGMTAGFWQDPDRYLDTYWRRWPGTWLHGDFAFVDEDGFWYILGRSDDTIKVAGKRLGPAEAEAAALSHPAVKEAAAVGLPDPVKGEVLAIFAVAHPGADLAALPTAVADAVAAELGKALRPAVVHVVAELPRTRSGKIVRRAVRAAFLGLPAGDLSTLENPQAVEAIAKLGRRHAYEP